MKLSIIIPVFNEEKTILQVLKRLNDVKIPGIVKEIIVVDDGSWDSTPEKIKSSKFFKKIKFAQHAINQGKGKALQTGIKEAKGDYIIIQDADLEYNPNDIGRLILAINKDKKIEVVYGTRLNRPPNFSRDERTLQFALHYMGNRFLSFLVSVLYGQWITDMETCYKLFPKKALKNIRLNAKGFEFEPEITSKLLKKGYKIKEIPISTNPRGYEEGKKLNTIKDGTLALWSIFKYRFFD